MAIILRKATPEDAVLITNTRRLVWEQTYRGIYPDEKIDHYDYAYHLHRDTQLLSSGQQHYYLYMDGDTCIGYFSFGPYNYGSYQDFTLCLNNLYVLDGYQGKGLGKMAFSHLHAYARQQGIDKYFCGCNAHNHKAQRFYLHMGGIIGQVRTGHADPSQDTIYFEFHI